MWSRTARPSPPAAERVNGNDNSERDSDSASSLDKRLIGEMNVSSLQRGPFQNAYVGYWVDERMAGHGYIPEALVVAMQFAFDDLQLHRLQIAIIPRNGPSRRVVEKLGIRLEGMAERYLEINGVWEDHMRYAITTEEWADRRRGLLGDALRKFLERIIELPQMNLTARARIERPTPATLWTG